MASPKVTFKITSEEKFSENIADNKPAYSAGQIIFVEGLNRIYLDFHGTRTCYTSSYDGLRFIGVSETVPTSSAVIIKGKVNPVTAHVNDMVVVGTKEYLYRYGGQNG